MALRVRQVQRRRFAGDEADQALVKAVTDKGLSVEEYTAILEVAQTDPVVKDKQVERLKK